MKSAGWRMLGRVVPVAPARKSRPPLLAGSARRRMDVDDFAPRLSFFFNAHIDFFEEIAKYRAARRIWARELKETFGAKNPRSWLMRFHTQTAGCRCPRSSP
jgi:methylmalonyl-CoA mutase, N-terminal domain